MSRNSADCEDCGQTIEFGTAAGLVQPDAEVSCDGCGAVHIVSLAEESSDGAGDADCWLTLSKRGGEVIAELRAALEEERALSDRRRAALEADAGRNELGRALADARASVADLSAALVASQEYAYSQARGFKDMEKIALGCAAERDAARAEVARLEEVNRDLRKAISVSMPPTPGHLEAMRDIARVQTNLAESVERFNTASAAAIQRDVLLRMGAEDMRERAARSVDDSPYVGREGKAEAVAAIRALPLEKP